MDATGTNVGVVTAALAADQLDPTGGVVAAPADGGDGGDLPAEVSIRRIRADEALLLRSLRLLALRDAPAAFAGGVAAELAVDAAEWACRARDCASRQDDYLAIVNRLGTPSGFVRAYTPPTEPHWRELTAMWVAPWARGIGAGDALIEAAVGWAEQVGAAVVTLWVNLENAVAQRLYARHGFAVVGEPSGAPGERRWLRMCRPLRAAGGDQVRVALGNAGRASEERGSVGLVVGGRARW
jgi:ribosomal protein S18 acetylase RimI-like enzyme